MAKVFKIIYIFTILYSFSSAQTNTDYCSLSCGDSKHTVCLRQDENCGAGPTCGPNYRPIPLTDADRRLILDVHNDLRNKIASGKETTGAQPSASNMKALSYSKELETIAQCHTNKCVFEHDKCRRSAAHGWVGQNLGLRSSTATDNDNEAVIKGAIQSWFDEVKDFNNTWVDSFGYYPTTKVVGHYTQAAWADTTKVGCGLTFYDSGNWNNWFVACNYAPGGNINTQSVYKVGKPASECGASGVNSNYPDLCGPDDILDS
ncbi:venom allergen 3 [Diabrotica virgifera virgifera]|uniref:Venom allergen 3-like n=1 Tax=Diabrotica virgifera virgifera TaxID=50390 RepID=A0A6P7F7K0_DIAVI|nr:venom allergen 3 [Diabrotica virgifera virgifera]